MDKKKWRGPCARTDVRTRVAFFVMGHCLPLAVCVRNIAIVVVGTIVEARIIPNIVIRASSVMTMSCPVYGLGSIRHMLHDSGYLSQMKMLHEH